jgi:hypothetical protein
MAINRIFRTKMKLLKYFPIWFLTASCGLISTSNEAKSIAKNETDFAKKPIWQNQTQKLLNSIIIDDVNTLKTYFTFPIIDSLTYGMTWAHIRNNDENHTPSAVAFLSEKEFEQHHKSIFFESKFIELVQQLSLDSVAIKNSHSVSNEIKKEYFSVIFDKKTNQIMFAFEDVVTDPTHREEYPNGKILYFDIQKNGMLSYNSTEIID